ncbi:MAG: DUF1080 domain-containing protein [Bacteroidales bacterium]|nr:DUF1080 domain-containing protein [Bacteroidales bacterium]
MKKTVLIFSAISFFLFYGCFNHTGKKKAGSRVASAYSLTKQDKEDGWQLLFDGKSFKGWRSLGMDSIPSAYWNIENGVIHKIARKKVKPLPDGKLPPSCDLMTADTFMDFELVFDWKISPGGNSGVKYNVSEEMSVQHGSTHALGFEYQIIDDLNYPQKLEPLQHTACLYALVPARGALPKPAGAWNSGRIVFKGNHGEHWLNGQKVTEYELGTPHFDSLFHKSKYHIHPDFPVKRYGHIVLQDHADDVWFRNLKIRILN